MVYCSLYCCRCCCWHRLCMIGWDRPKRDRAKEMEQIIETDSSMPEDGGEVKEGEEPVWCSCILLARFALVKIAIIFTGRDIGVRCQYAMGECLAGVCTYYANKPRAGPVWQLYTTGERRGEQVLDADAWTRHGAKIQKGRLQTRHPGNVEAHMQALPRQWTWNKDFGLRWGTSPVLGCSSKLC